MSRLCISKNHKYPYIKFNWFMGIQHSSLGFNKELTARVCGFEVKEFNDKYPEYAIEYDMDEHGDALIKVHIPANGDTVIGGYITTIKDDATKSENYTTYATETLSGYDCYNLDDIFTARMYGNAFSIWRTDDGRLYIHKLKYVYHSADITRHISSITGRIPRSWCVHDQKWMAAYEENTKQLIKPEVNTMTNIRIFNAHVVMSNFAGHKSLYNSLGKRSITISMPMKDVDPDTPLGKVVGKIGKVRTIGDETYAYITIKINESMPLKVLIDCGGSYTMRYNMSNVLNHGDEIDTLLREGKHINIVCEPRTYTLPKGLLEGGTGYALYLKAIRFERASNNWFDDKDTWEQGELPFDYEEQQAQKIANSVTGISKEVKKVMPKNFDKVVVSGPATIAWINGKKVMVKKSESDTYDYEKAMLALMVKSFFGDDEAAFHRWCRTNLKTICKAVKKDAKLSAEKAERKSKKNAPAPKNKVGEQNSYNRWTKEELDFLLANYKTMTNKALGEHLGRSYASVQTQLNRLKLTRG